MARPPDDRDAAQNIARDLAEIASCFTTLKGDAYTWLTDSNYQSLVHRIEDAHASVEAAVVEACEAQRGTPAGALMDSARRESATADFIEHTCV